MPANCPPPESFEVVTPGQAKDEVLRLDSQAEQFGADLDRELSKRIMGASPTGEILYPAPWAELSSSWLRWRASWRQYRDAHDEWSENIDSASVVRQVDLFKCDLLDYREKLRALGGTPTGPEPRFTQPSNTLLQLGLVLVGAAALYYVAKRP